MIEGLKIEVPASELMHLLDERIDRHRTIAADCDRRRVRLEARSSPDPDDTEGQLAAAWPPYLAHLEHRARRHRDRAARLVFLREHVVAHEVYRLAEPDLRVLGLWPGASWRSATAAHGGDE